MSKIEELIQQYCPDGVEYKPLEDVCNILDKKRKPVKSVLRIEGPYPYYGANGIQDYISDYIFDGTFVLVGEDGSVINSKGNPIVTWATGKIWVNNHAHIISESIVNLRYLYHYLQTVDVKHLIRGNIPKLNQTSFRSIQIPIPPMEVQKEIVRVLDSFTELETELETELSLRQKQYEYYRDQLLTFDKDDPDVKWTILGDISKYRRGSFPQPYGKMEWYGGEGAMPFVQVADIADNMQLVPDTKRKISVIAQPKSVFAPQGSIIISLQGSIGRIAITQYDAFIDRTVAIFQSIDSSLLPKYFVYQLQRVFNIKKEKARGSTIRTITKEEFTAFSIPIPPLSEQKRIVEILDKFDALVNDISIGIPAEIEARRKQYEYYRDKLLDFKKKD